MKATPEENLVFAKTLIATYMLALTSVVEAWAKRDPEVEPGECVAAVVKVSALGVDELSEGEINAFISHVLDLHSKP